MTDWGFQPEDFDGGGQPDELKVWPDNWLAVEVYCVLNTQWDRGGMSGAATGLKYGDFPNVFRLMGIARSEWPSLFSDLRVMERAALDRMNEENERNQSTT